MFLLEATAGEYSDKTEFVIGLFETKEEAETAKEMILEKADRNLYTWCYIDCNYMKMEMFITEYEVGKIYYKLG
mgnify:CR=1 FL=1